MSISTRFAMDTYGIMFQTMVPGGTTSYLLAKQIGNLLTATLMEQNLAVVNQVAGSSANDHGLFNLYIKFDWAPDPYVALKFLSKCCLELNGLHFEVFDPLNYHAYVKLPFEIKEADLDNALLLIRQNIPKLISKVSEGMDLYIEQM
jgi:hypothetical protein